MGNFRLPESPQEISALLPHVAVGAKVEIVGERGTYVVVRVDPQRYTADLMLVSGRSTVELGVRFESLRVLPAVGAEGSPDRKLSRVPSKDVAVD